MAVRACKKFDLSGKFREEYKSLKDAAKDTGLPLDKISRACVATEKLMESGLSVWTDKEGNSITAPRLSKIKPRFCGISCDKYWSFYGDFNTLACYDENGILEKVYSIEEAAKEFNTAKRNLLYACREGLKKRGYQLTERQVEPKDYKQYGSFRWAYTVSKRSNDVDLTNFRPIPSFEEFLLSKTGEIYNTKKKIFMKISDKSSVGLRKNGRRKYFSLTTLIPQVWKEATFIRDSPKKSEEKKEPKRRTIDLIPDWNDHRAMETIIFHNGKYFHRLRHTHILASREGDILSQKTMKMIGTSGKEYESFSIRLGKDSSVYVKKHVLLATIFVPNPEKKPIVNHKNGNKKDNRISNLEWVSHFRNAAEAARLGLSKRKGNIYTGEESADEKWKPASDPRYSVSSNGRIKNNKTGQLLSQRLNNNGYYRVTLGHANNKVYVHREVAKAFLSVSKNKVVNHKDGNKKNNRLSNLEVISYSQNNTHARDMGLNNDRKPVECQDKEGNILKFRSISEAARKLGIDPANISSCCCGRFKSYKGYEWQYSS